MFRTCTSVPLYLCIFAGGTYLGNLHIGQADKIQCQDLHVFFSLGEILVFWFIGRYWKMVGGRSDGCWALGLGVFCFVVFSFGFFF